MLAELDGGDAATAPQNTRVPASAIVNAARRTPRRPPCLRRVKTRSLGSRSAIRRRSADRLPAIADPDDQVVVGACMIMHAMTAPIAIAWTYERVYDMPR